MEEICGRFPLMADNILEQLDHQSLGNSKMVSREICEFLENGRVLWKKMILKNITGKLSKKSYL